MFVYLINMEQVRVCLILCLLSAGYYMGMCVAAPEKNLVNIYQVGWLVLSACSLHGATPSVVYLRKHIYADVDPGEQGSAFGE